MKQEKPFYLSFEGGLVCSYLILLQLLAVSF